MFTQVLDPLDNLTLTCLVALIPVVALLVMLAVFRLPAWLATLIGSAITFVLALWVWKMPMDQGSHAYFYGAATGFLKDSIDDCLPDLGGKLGDPPEIFPPG